MPTDKDFKRRVRGRMQKTGESYTAARATLLKSTHSPAARPVVELHAASPRDYPRLAGMSDAAIKARTGCTWEKWVKSLDHHKAYDWSHREIADFIRKSYKTGDWWTQTVTVGYERIKGLRVRGQQRGGSFRVTKSKTFPVPVTRLYRAWKTAASRRAWLGESGTAMRSGQPNKVLRLDWPDGTTVEARFTAKSAKKSQVALEHAKLTDQAAATRIKAFWTDRLSALAERLDGKGGAA